MKHIDRSIEITCPKCNKQFVQEMSADIVDIDCPFCNAPISLDCTEALKGINSVESELDDLRITLRNFGK